MARSPVLLGKNDKTKLRVKKRTSIGSGMPLNKQKRRNWKAYRGQGRV